MESSVNTVLARASDRSFHMSPVLTAHAVFATLAWAFFFPVGGIVIRLLNRPGLIWIHAAIQAFALVLYTIGFGLGVYIALKYHHLSNKHSIIGIVIFILAYWQPVSGMVHHWIYKKKPVRNAWSHSHLWLGRILITLGIINGGFGLQLANNPAKNEIAYGVVAGVFWLFYIACVIVGERRRKARAEVAVSAPRDSEETLQGAQEKEAV